MQPKVLALTLAALLLGATGMILAKKARTTPPTPAVAAVDDRSTPEMVVNAASLAVAGELQTLYQVKKGDTLFGISRKFDVSVKAIQDANKDKSTIVKVDQWIVIPK